MNPDDEYYLNHDNGLIYVVNRKKNTVEFLFTKTGLRKLATDSPTAITWFVDEQKEMKRVPRAVGWSIDGVRGYNYFLKHDTQTNS